MKKIFLRGFEVPATTNNLIRAKIDRLEWAIGAANYARESERVEEMVKKIAELKRLGSAKNA